MARKYVPQQRIGENGLEWFFINCMDKEVVRSTYERAEEEALDDDMWDLVEGMGESALKDFLIHLGHEYGFDVYEKLSNWQISPAKMRMKH